MYNQASVVPTGVKEGSRRRRVEGQAKDRKPLILRQSTLRISRQKNAHDRALVYIDISSRLEKRSSVHNRNHDDSCGLPT